jgi:hypothetical protein
MIGEIVLTPSEARTAADAAVKNVSANEDCHGNVMYSPEVAGLGARRPNLFYILGPFHQVIGCGNYWATNVHTDMGNCLSLTDLVE